MPIFMEYEGVKGIATAPLSIAVPPVPDNLSIVASGFTTCTSPAPDTVCVSMTFLNPTSEPFDSIIFSFVNTTTGGVDSETSLFAPGSFDAFGTYISTDGNTTLTLSAVPEAGVWLMLIAGFGLIGAALRRRRAPVTAAP